MVPEIWSTTDRIFCHVGPFFALLPHQQHKKSKFWKIEKMPGVIIILHKCTKNHDHILYCSWGVACDRLIFTFHFELFFALLPHPFTARKIKIGDIIIFHMGNKNYDQILYSSWDMVCNRQMNGKKSWVGGGGGRGHLKILYLTTN